MKLRSRIVLLIALSGVFAAGPALSSERLLSPELSSRELINPISIKIHGPFLIERQGYSVCYDGRTRNPIWVYERLSREDLQGEASRLSRFFEDRSLPKHVRSTNSDYLGSSYNRGHLAAAGNHKNSQNAMNETFFLTNISPQTGFLFNRKGGAWHSLEHLVREWVHKGYVVHVISGPLYLPQENKEGKRLVSYLVIGSHDVAVPTHFFKVLFIEQENGVTTLAYILPNQAVEWKSLDQFQVPLSEVKNWSGLEIDILPNSGIRQIN